MPERSAIRLPGRPVGVRVSAPQGRAGSPEAPSAPEPAAETAADEQALAAERAELASARQALEKGLAELAALRRQLVRQAEEELVALALDIARKVLMQEIQAGRYEIDPIVQEALERVPSQQGVVAHLHPEDWSRCQRAQSPQRGEGGSGGVRFVADPGVARGECILETCEGIVQSSVDDDLERIGEALRRPE